MISKFFIERPVLSNVIAILMILIGGVCAVQPGGRAISRRRAADRAGHDALSRRQRQDRDRHRGAADRAAGQRRRGHDLHAVLQRRRRHLYADGDVQDRHRSQLRAGAGAEPRVERAVAAAAVGAEPGRHRAEEVDRDPAVRHADLAERDLRQPLPVATTPPSTSGTSCRGCRASATSRCSAPASIRCGSGSIRTSCRRAR